MGKYNKKIVQTPSYVEIWEYEQSIFTDKKTKRTADTRPTKRRTFDELTEEEQSKRLQRMKKTRLDAKWHLLRLVDCNFDDKTSFLTLTTKENIKARDEFKKLLKTFIKRFNYNIFKTKKSQLKYIAVLEKQKRGAWHAHMLLFDVPFIPHRQLLDLWGHGAVRVNKVDVDSKDNRGRYVTKYFEKGIGQELLENFGKHPYLSSNNLRQPIVDKNYEPFDYDFSDTDILYESEYSSKTYNKGEYVNSKVKYKKIKLNKKECDWKVEK
ncbi:rolling circle replication-associated protein [Streptococcus hyointestinalis]|uniref:rolling circle replication-associated protein n=1 Tax=Streptococcus hyointestinalis TaxID=1337 RepID=UPI003D017E50